jgi:DNA polymerase-1
MALDMGFEEVLLEAEEEGVCVDPVALRGLLSVEDPSVRRYAEAMLARMDPLSRVRPVYDARKRTGRAYTAGPNIQGAPVHVDPRVAMSIVAPPSCALVRIDYRQVELRLLAHHSGDQALLAAFAAGVDPHAELAEALGGSRPLAKTIHYQMIYGAGRERLRTEVIRGGGFSWHHASRVVDGWFRRHLAVQPWRERVVRLARGQGFLENSFGRRERFCFDPGKEDCESRRAVNFVLQSDAADVMRTAARRVQLMFSDGHARSRISALVHDELRIHLHPDDAGAVVPAARAMCSFPQFRVPFEVNVQVGATLAGSGGPAMVVTEKDQREEQRS